MSTTGSSTIDNGLKPDTTAGEYLKVNIPGTGLIEITDLLEWPFMQGWVQFFVASLNPFVEDIDGNEDQNESCFAVDRKTL